MMIGSIKVKRSSVMKKVRFNFQLVLIAAMFFVSLTHGRFLNVPLKSTESTNSRTNGIADVQSRGWPRNRAKNSEARDPRLSELEWSTYSRREPNGPGTFAFGYDNVMDSRGNEHYRSEEKLNNGTVIGEYGYTDFASRRMVRVTYTADNRGYRAKTEIIPMEDFYFKEIDSLTQI